MSYGKILRRASILAVAAGGLLVSSCTTLLQDVLKKPELSVEDVRVQNVALNELALELVLKVKNPNNFTVALAGIDYQVDAMGMTLGQGATKEPLKLEPNLAQDIVIPLSLKPEAAFRFAQAYLTKSKGKDLLATVQTTVHFDTPVGPLSLNFSDDQKVR